MKTLGGTHGRWAAVVSVALIAMAMLVAGCGGDSSSTGSSSGTSETESATASSSGEGSTGNGEGKTIGILSLVKADEAGTRITDAMEKRAGELGYKTTLIDANYEPPKELAAMDTFINQGVSAILTESADTELLKPKIKAAEAAGIPVIAVNGGPVVQPGTTLAINVPEEEEGMATAEAFFKEVKEKRGGESAKVIEMVLPEASPCRLRAQGFDKVASKYPELEVVKYQIDGTNPVGAANTYVAEYLQGNSDTAGVLSCWDVPLEGALTAIEQIKPSDFTAMGINGTSTMVAKLQEGNEYLDGDMAFALAEAGYDAATAADEAITGETANFPASKEEKVQYELFTPETVPKAPAIENPEWLPKGWEADYWK